MVSKNLFLILPLSDTGESKDGHGVLERMLARPDNL